MLVHVVNNDAIYNYIGILDINDIWEHNKLEIQAAKLKEAMILFLMMRVRVMIRMMNAKKIMILMITISKLSAIIII